MSTERRLHDYNDFMCRLDRWVKDTADPSLTRSWRIMRGCVTVHAMVDRDSDDLGESLRVAWEDVYEAFDGGSRTFVMDALVQDMLLASGGVVPPLLAVVDEAFESASKSSRRKMAKATLTPLEGGKS